MGYELLRAGAEKGLAAQKTGGAYYRVDNMRRFFMFAGVWIIGRIF